MKPLILGKGTSMLRGRLVEQTQPPRLVKPIALQVIPGITSTCFTDVFLKEEAMLGRWWSWHKEMTCSIQGLPLKLIRIDSHVIPLAPTQFQFILNFKWGSYSRPMSVEKSIPSLESYWKVNLGLHLAFQQ